MPPAKLHLAIAPAFLEKLRTIAAEAGLPVDDYAAGVIQQHVLAGGLGVSVKRSVGRPVATSSDDLPEGVERSATASGFGGVTKYGRQWQAKVGGTVLGRFSSAELAASVRHYALLGFRVGRGAYLCEVGMPLTDAMHFAVSAVYDVLPDGGASLASLRAFKEAAVPSAVAPLPSSMQFIPLQCPVCAGMLVNAEERRVGRVCKTCAADYDAWDALPCSGEPPAPRLPKTGEWWPMKGAAVNDESFLEYAARVRKERGQ